MEISNPTNQPCDDADSNNESLESGSDSITHFIEDTWSYPYGPVEVTWGIILVISIFGVNLWILWIIGRTRELWKPRHLWMACLCITDLFVGGHKLLELIILTIPETIHGLCILQKATIGIPYVINILLLTLLSLDRFIAVCYPFFYSATVSNKHVMIGFVIVILTGIGLAAVSITIGLHDPICRAQSIQLVYLTVILTICSILTLLFNSSVLRIAKKQLNAIYAQEPSYSEKRLSMVCSNCGFKNETYVNTLVPIPASIPLGIPPSSTPGGGGNGGNVSEMHVQFSTSPRTTLLPLTDTVMALELSNGENLSPMNFRLDMDVDSISISQQLMDESTSPLVRTISLPTIPDTMSVPISLVVQPDPHYPPTVVLGSVQADVDNSCKMNSMSQLDTSPNAPSNSNHIPISLPRSRSLISCRRIMPPVGTRLQLFRNLHFARAHMFHVGRLFPSIRFARTVLLIMVPMWAFLLPIVIIIPLHRSCVDGLGDFDCSIVDVLWKYLLVHMRSILPLQAVIDTLIYATGSKEFREALKKIIYRRIRKK